MNERSLDVARTLLLNALASAAAEEIDLPHIVVCRDPATGRTTYSGPYPSLPEALIGADAEDTELNAHLRTGEPRWEFTVAALYAPHPSTQTATEDTCAAA